MCGSAQASSAPPRSSRTSHHCQPLRGLSGRATGGGQAKGFGAASGVEMTEQLARQGDAERFDSLPSAESAPIEFAALERRTFAIISHPDAGKTTLTEKLLHAAGAIHEAGEVKARGDRRRARSDWMQIEQQRGISVTSSVMTFRRGPILFNLLDTPGHQDFSEDTYRTLTAVDSAIMVIDAAKGIEAQTRKLFEVCRLRNIPIITFINKVDREGLSAFD